MSYYLILKSTLDNIVSKLRGRDSSIGTTTGSQIASKISGLEMVQSINPTSTLYKSKQSYTIPKGRNTGGVVSVNDQSKTITPSASDQTISADSGFALSSMLVKKVDDHPFYCKTDSVSSSDTSYTVSGLSFTPKGIMMNSSQSLSGSASNGRIACIYADTSGNVNGTAESSSSSQRGGVTINSATVTASSGSISISNITTTGGVACKFNGSKYVIAVWG